MKIIAVSVITVAALAAMLFGFLSADHLVPDEYVRALPFFGMGIIGALFAAFGSVMSDQKRNRALLDAGMILTPCVIAACAVWNPLGLWFSILVAGTVAGSAALGWHAEAAYPEYRNQYPGIFLSILATALFLVFAYGGKQGGMTYAPAALFAGAWLLLSAIGRPKLRPRPPALDTRCGMDRDAGSELWKKT